MCSSEGPGDDGSAGHGDSREKPCLSSGGLGMGTLAIIISISFTVGGSKVDQRSRYQRNFLIFNPEDAGFGVGQEPSGYIKIEVNDGRGKLVASVQNLSENRGLQYTLYMFQCDEGKFASVCAGKIPLSRNKGELKWEFDPANVGGSKIPVQELNVAAVIGEDEKSDGMLVLCPLVAYKNGKVSWREPFRSTMRMYKQEKPKPKSEEVKPEAVEKKPEAVPVLPEKEEIPDNVTSKYEYQLESKHPGQEITDTEENSKEEEETENLPVVDNLEEEISADNLPGNADNLPENKESQEVEEPAPEENVQENPVEETKEVEPIPQANDFDEYQKMLKNLEMEEKGVEGENSAGCGLNNSGFCIPPANAAENMPCSNCQTNGMNLRQSAPAEKQQGNIERLRVNLDKYFEAYDPFRSRRRDYRWWKVGSPVQFNNILYQCDIKTPLLFNPALMMAHFKYRHLIVGIYSDRVRRREYIVCGVPGVYNVDDKPFGNMCRWAQVEGNRPRHGAFGYWLVYIDGKSGKFLSVN